MAAWCDILISLRDFLVADGTLSGKTIKAGALDPDDFNSAISSGLIFVYRDREYDESLHNGGEGLITLCVECWTRDDSVDPAAGYAKLAALEDLFTTALDTWVRTLDVSLLGTDVLNASVIESIGDTDSKRPVIGSRKTIKITWSQRTS